MVDFLALPGVLSSIGSALNRGPEKQIGKVTNRTVAINIDQWFRDAYEKVAGPWNFTSEKQSILPLALLPLEVVEECSHQRARRDLDPTMSERVTSTLGSSPFCLLDQGGHRFSAEGKCKACGFDKQLEYKRYRKWKGKKKVASGSSEP